MNFPIRHSMLRATFFGFLIFFAGCEPAAVKPVTSATWFPVKLGNAPLEVQLALTPDEMATGLMHRTSLGENQGMLFVFNRPGPRSFYMLNTIIPLSIGYFTPDGVLAEIHDLQPHDATPVPSRSSDILFVLEVNQGWFSRNKITPGTQLNLKQVNEAVRQREKASSANPLGLR